jgi:hypothetical protein
MQIAEHLMHVYCDYSLKKNIVACHFHQISVTSWINTVLHDGLEECDNQFVATNHSAKFLRQAPYTRIPVCLFIDWL